MILVLLLHYGLVGSYVFQIQVQQFLYSLKQSKQSSYFFVYAKDINPIGEGVLQFFQMAISQWKKEKESGGLKILHFS